MACVVTESGDFPLEKNYPASIRSHPAAAYPLGRIHVLELADDPAPEIELEVIVSNLNVDDDLEALVFVDTLEREEGLAEIPALGGPVDRHVDIGFDASALLVPGCHRVELQVSRRFVRQPPVGVPICPAEDGDVGTAVWWFFTREQPTSTFDPAQCPVRQPSDCPD